MGFGFGFGLGECIRPTIATDGGSANSRVAALRASASGDMIISGTEAANLFALVSSSAGSEFDPSHLSGLVLWLAADRGSPTSSLWTDQSGNGHNATSTNGPTVNANGMGTGKPGMVFNGSSNWMQTDTIDLTALNKIRLYWCGLGLTSTTKILFEHGPTTAGVNGAFQIAASSINTNDLGFLIGMSAAGAFSDQTFTPSGFGSVCQFNCLFDHSVASGATVRYNRAAQTLGNHNTGTQNTGNFISAVLNIGARNGGASLFENCTMGEIIICSGADPGSDTANVESYFQKKWGTP